MKHRDVLDSIRGAGGNLSHGDQGAIKEALHIRNFLAHEFFHKHNPVMSASECQRVAIKISKIEARLEAAYTVLQPLRKKLEERLGLSAHRKKAEREVWERAIRVIASFDDS